MSSKAEVQAISAGCTFQLSRSKDCEVDIMISFCDKQSIRRRGSSAKLWNGEWNVRTSGVPLWRQRVYIPIFASPNKELAL